MRPQCLNLSHIVVSCERFWRRAKKGPRKREAKKVESRFKYVTTNENGRYVREAGQHISKVSLPRGW